MTTFLHAPDDGDAPTPVRNEQPFDWPQLPVGARSWPHIDREFIRYEVTRALLMLAILGIRAIILWAIDLITKLAVTR